MERSLEADDSSRGLAGLVGCGPGFARSGGRPSTAKLARREVPPLQKGVGGRPRETGHAGVGTCVPRRSRCFPRVELHREGRRLPAFRRGVQACQRHGRLSDERGNGKHLSPVRLPPARLSGRAPAARRFPNRYAGPRLTTAPSCRKFGRMEHMALERDRAATWERADKRTARDGKAPRRPAVDLGGVIFLLVPSFSMIAFASAAEPLRLADRVPGKEACRWRVLRATAARSSRRTGSRSRSTVPSGRRRGRPRR